MDVPMKRKSKVKKSSKRQKLQQTEAHSDQDDCEDLSMKSETKSKKKTVKKKRKQKEDINMEEQQLDMEEQSENDTADDSTEEEDDSSSTLVVYNVPLDATENSVQKLFKKATSIKIIKRVKKNSCIAFVEFDTIAKATKAMQKRNGKTMSDGHILNIEYRRQTSKSTSNTKPSVNRTRLYIWGMSPNTTEELLQQAFNTAISAIIDTQVHEDKGTIQRYGCVAFSTESEATEAYRIYSKKPIDGRKVRITFKMKYREKEKSSFRPTIEPPMARRKQPPQEPSKRIAIYGLNYETTKETFEGLFPNAKSARMARKNGEFQGFGFATFETLEEAKAAFHKMDQATVDGRYLRVKYETKSTSSDPVKPKTSKFNPKSKFGEDRKKLNKDLDDKPTKRLCVRGLPLSYNEAQVSREFYDAENVVIYRDKSTGDSQGFGFVYYNSVDTAKDAYRRMNGRQIAGQDIEVVYAQKNRWRAQSSANS